jgi:hypothetical protein
MSVTESEFKDLGTMVTERCRDQVIRTAHLFEGDETQIQALILTVAIEMIKGAIKVKMGLGPKKISRNVARDEVMTLLFQMAKEGRI